MKLLLDTNVLIAFFRNPSQRERFENRMRRPHLLMSSVVALELFAGCRTSRQKRELESFLKPFEKAHRIVAPDHESFCEAGRVLAAFGEEGMGALHRRSIANDVLIAVTAVRAGVVVVTANSNDFSLIGKHTPVHWIVPG